MIAVAPLPTTTPTPQKKAPFEFTDIGDADTLNILVYGDYGVGKTTLAATASDVPAMQDVLFINAEAGEKSLKNFQGKLTKVDIFKYSQLARIFEYLSIHCRYRDAGNEQALAMLESQITGKVPEKPKHFRTAIIDSLTEVQKYLMYQLLGVEIGKQHLDLPPDTAEFKEWGQSSEMIQLLIRSFRDLPMNVIIVCAMQEVENEKKQQLKRLNLPGKLATNVQGFLDAVGYMSKAKDAEGNVLRRLYIEAGPTFQAKNRFPNTSVEYIDEPTMGKILALETAPRETTSNAPANTAAGPTQPRPAPAATRPATRPAARAPVRAVSRGPVRAAGRG